MAEPKDTVLTSNNFPYLVPVDPMDDLQCDSCQ